MKKTLISGGSLVKESSIDVADVLIGVDGKIENVAAKIQDHKDAEVIDAKGLLLFPLLIDCHVHFREPGLTHKATMATEAAAALAGGVGCVCEMPNTIPPTVTVAALADKVRTAAKVDGCVIKFFFGVTEALHLAALKELWTSDAMEMKRLKIHCCGVKLYLDHSTGNQKANDDVIEDVFKTCAELKIPLVAHCEDPAMNAKFDIAGKSDVALHSVRRPAESEAKSVAEAIALAKKYGTPFHVAHLSTKGALEYVRKAKKEKLSVTCEVSPHHLFLSTDDYGTLGTLGKMNPPLRSKDDQKSLWEALKDGTVDCIATDHAPHTLEEKKTGNPLEAPSGVPGVETMLPLLLTAAANKKMSYSDIVRLCFANPNRIFSLHQSEIIKGAEARIAIVDPKKEWPLLRAHLKTKCGWSPFEGRKMVGGIVQTIRA